MRAYVPDSSPSTRRGQAHRRRWLAAVAASILLATLTTGTATAARPAAMAADDPTVLSDWNALAVTTLVGDTTKMGPVTFLYMGFVQAAVYDAVVGVEGRYAPTGSMATRPGGPPRRRPRSPPPTRSWSPIRRTPRPTWTPPTPRRWRGSPTARPSAAASPSAPAWPTT